MGHWWSYAAGANDHLPKPTSPFFFFPKSKVWNLRVMNDSRSWHAWVHASGLGYKSSIDYDLYHFLSRVLVLQRPVRGEEMALRRRPGLRRRKRRERLHRRCRWPLPPWVSNKWRWGILFVFWYGNFEFKNLFYFQILCLRRWRFQVRQRSVHSEDLAVRQEQGLSRRFWRGWMRWVAHVTAISDPGEFIYLLYSYPWTVSTSLITGTW